MAEVALITGDSGVGKSSSMRTIPPQRCFVIDPVGKGLPFQGSKKNYKSFDLGTGQGNIYSTKKTSTIAKVLQYVSDSRPEVKVIVIDDNQYLSLFTFIARINEKSFDKFNDIAVNMVELVEFCKSLRDDLIIFFMQHIEMGDSVSGGEQIQAKTMGKFVKEKVTYEGLFSTVLLADKEADEHGEINYFFWTQRANATVKTPMGMFKDQKIPNDLYAVAKRIKQYYHEEA